MESLAKFLSLDDPRSPEAREAAAQAPDEPTLDGAVDITDPKKFCERVLASREFRQYILHGIVIGDLPPAVVTRVMDHGWGKPPERHEHTGRDGGPIAAVTEVRRIIVHPSRVDDLDAVLGEKKNAGSDPKLTH